MNSKLKMNLFGVYEMLLAIGAVVVGVLMICNTYGLYNSFVEFPTEWTDKVSFDSWIVPGIIAIVIFGVGNIVSAMLSLKKYKKQSSCMGVLMGALLIFSIIIQIKLLGVYLGSIELIFLGVIQVAFGIYVLKDSYVMMKKTE